MSWTFFLYWKISGDSLDVKVRVKPIRTHLMSHCQDFSMKSHEDLDYTPVLCLININSTKWRVTELSLRDINVPVYVVSRRRKEPQVDGRCRHLVV